MKVLLVLLVVALVIGAIAGWVWIVTSAKRLRADKQRLSDDQSSLDTVALALGKPVTQPDPPRPRRKSGRPPLGIDNQNHVLPEDLAKLYDELDRVTTEMYAVSSFDPRRDVLRTYRDSIQEELNETIAARRQHRD